LRGRGGNGPASVAARARELQPDSGHGHAFRGALGSVDRPYARPGDFVELRLSPTCDAASPGFAAPLAPAAQVVTIAFRPTGSEATLVVVAPDCPALAAATDACAAEPGVGRMVCLAARPDDVTVVERDGQRRLLFRFPDTDLVADGIDNDRPLAGPTVLAVTRVGEPLPCGVGRGGCAARPSGLVACIDESFAVDGSCGETPHETFASFTALPNANDYQALCVDPSPLCSGRATELRFAVDGAGNVLLPMDWRGVLPPGALNAAAGSALPPARLLRISARLAAFGGGGVLRVPGNEFVHAYAPNGGLLPPVFEPQVYPGLPDRLVLFGSADAPETVLRLSRRSPAFLQCAGGAESGRPCVSAGNCPGGACGAARCSGGVAAGAVCGADDDCPGGECGAALFDFRALAGAGTAAVSRFGAGLCQDTQAPCDDDAGCGGGRCVAFRAIAEESVPLEGLIESPSVLVSVVPEALDGRDLNGDGDATDQVLLLSDRRSGLRQPIGRASAAGRAATRVSEPPFSYPEVAAEDDVVAFLEAEPLQGEGGRNRDGDQFDTLLRVVRSTPLGAVDLTRDLALAVDATPRIDGRAVVVRDGVVWVRAREADGAPQRITRVSLASDGSEGDGPSRRPSLSADATAVAFESSASTLTPDGSGVSTVYVHDRIAATTARLTVGDTAALARAPTLSGDGRWVAVVAPVPDNGEQVFVLDRDGDGVFDQSGSTATIAISTKPDGVHFGAGSSLFPSITPDGRYVAFLSESDLLGIGGISPEAKAYRVWRRDRDADGDGRFEHAVPGLTAVETELTSVNNTGGQPSAAALSQAPALAADGRTVAFGDFDPNLALADANYLCLNPTTSGQSCADIIVRDFTTRFTSLISLSTAGEQGNANAQTPALSADGRQVAFLSAADNLVAGDSNDVMDVFVHDRQSRSTERVSVASDGTPGDGTSFDRAVALSPDGRFVAFGSTAGSLGPGDANTACDNDFDGVADDNCGDVFLHDRRTGFTRKVSRAADGGDGDGRSGFPSLAADGVTLAFESAAGNLVADDGNGVSDVFVAAPDVDAIASDLTGDGDVDDAVLLALDTAAAPPMPQVVAAAEMASIDGRCAALLTPERAAGVDLNGDGDVDDRVVQLACLGAAVRSLGLAADEVVLLPAAVAARASEAGAGRDLNGDGDLADAVVYVAPRAAPEDWINLGFAATALAGRGGVVAFLAHEDGAGDLNRDGDAEDDVVQVWFAADGALVNTGQAAEELVLGDRLLAFRTAEAAQGAGSLNGDDDRDDAVLQVYDLDFRRLLSTGQAATPCRFSACDPRTPYRVFPDTVKFLTFEREQGADLTGNGDQDELVLQTFNVRAAPAPGAPALRAAVSRVAANGGAASRQVVAAVRTGVCSDSGRACAVAADCGGDAACYAPPGVCDVDRGTPCNPGREAACPAGQSCVANAPGVGVCHERAGACTIDRDCPPGGACREAAAPQRRAADPFYAAAAGAEVVLASGVCVESLGPCAVGCAAGASCVADRCMRTHGACRAVADCPPAAQCAADLLVGAAADADHDGLADPFDNCAAVANIDQADADADGVGDACAASAPPPTPAVGPGADDDGCAVGPPSRGATPGLGLVILFAAYWRGRRRRADPRRRR